MSMFPIATPRASRRFRARIPMPCASPPTPCAYATLAAGVSLACALTALTALPARAEERVSSAPQATTLDAVRVRAARPATVETVEQAKARLDERAGGTALVDAQAYRGGRVSTPGDALGMAPGVFVQSRFGAEEARLSIRGSGLQRTFHGRGIALLQDGSPLNLADGGFDFQAVEPLAARYVEVYRGANALEYGAATLGGAINFVSSTGLDAPPVDLRVEAGSFSYRREQIALAGASGGADAYLGLTGLQQDGFRAHAKQENVRLFGNAGYRFGDALDGRVYLTHVDTRSELPGNLTLRQALDDPRAANAGNIALDQRRDFRLDRVAGKLAWTPAEGRSLVLSAYVADKALHHPIFQVLEQDSRDVGVDLRWRGEGSLGGLRNVLIAGVAFACGDTDDDRFLNVAGRKGARSNRFDQRATNASAYAENQTWLSERWTIVVGAQALRSTRRSTDEFVVDRDESFDVDDAGVSPKLGVRFLVDDGLQVFGNLSRSLEPPSFGELSGGPGVTPVDAQHATTLEFGMRLHRDTLDVDAAIYRARIDGELLSLTDGKGDPLGTVNAERTLHQGIELGVDRRFAAQWTASVNYLFNDFRFDGDRVYGDNVLAGVPPQLLRGALRWSAPGSGFYVAPNVEWAPQDAYVDHANTFRVPGYAIAGLRVGGTIGAQWSWFADARNLGDRRWIASTNVVADANGQDLPNVLPGDGRSLYVGLQWRR